MKRILAEKTRRVRYGLVKLVAPSLYYNNYAFLSSVPRPSILFIKSIFGDAPLNGVEIGVAGGENAESILKTLNMDRLFLVDPYLAYVENDVCVDYKDQKNEAHNKLSKFGNKVEFIYQTSNTAFDLIPNELDFVYVDGNHSYEFVKEDLTHYYPKIRTGGVLCGHDFRNDSLGVIKAVIEFTDKNSLSLNVERADWWSIK